MGKGEVEEADKGDGGGKRDGGGRERGRGGGRDGGREGRSDEGLRWERGRRRQGWSWEAHIWGKRERGGKGRNWRWR